MILKSQKFSIKVFNIKKKKKLVIRTNNLEEINAQFKNFKELKINLPIFKINKRNNCLSF